MKNLKVECLKCGKSHDFDSVARVWTAGWVPLAKDQYLCEMCSQLTDTDSTFEVDFIETKPIRDPEFKKKK